MRYITYTRSESGTLTRTHGRVTMPARERALDYPHAERLNGWPERAVYWNKPVGTGYALGLAPVRRP